MNAKRVVLGAWIATIGLTSVRQITDPVSPTWPLPGRFIASGVLFTTLYAAAGPLGSLAAALAAGVPIAIVSRPYLAGSGVSPLTTLAAWVGHIDGGPGAASRSAEETGHTGTEHTGMLG